MLSIEFNKKERRQPLFFILKLFDVTNEYLH